MKKRTLILVHPPQQGLLEGFSSGLISLANFVAAKESSIEVRLLDLGMISLSALESAIKTLITDISGDLFVGITTTTASYQSALKVARAFKRLSDKIVVVLGGYHASTQDDVILRHHYPSVDLVIRGEGEIALLELVRQYPDLSMVPGLSYLDGNAIRRNPSAPFLVQEELDCLPPMFCGQGLRSAPGKFDHVTYVSARGCRLECAFCSVGNQDFRAKSISSVIADLRILVGEYGYRRIAIEDNFFTHSPRRTLDLCAALEELQQDLSFTWDCQTRIESMHRLDIVEAMERGGCEAAYLGVEAFEPKQLIYLRKTPSPDSYLTMLEHQVVPQLLASRIDCYLNLQLGLPGEQQLQRDSTLLQLQRLGQKARGCGKGITIFPQLHVIYPGTQHFHEALQENRFGPDGIDIFEDFTRWESQQEPVLRWLGEHFAHGTGGIPVGILSSDRLHLGKFVIDSDAILRIVNQLEQIENIPGITIFKYSHYLTKMDETLSSGSE